MPNRIFIFISFALLNLTILNAQAHEGHHHHEEHLSLSEEAMRKACLLQINTDYVVKIKNIFKRSCFNCHSNQTEYPWYHGLPGIKQMIDSDINESKKHINMTNDFPFVGHGTPEEDLRAIRESILKGSMPPQKYSFFHPDSKLSDQEKFLISDWVNESLKALTNKK